MAERYIRIHLHCDNIYDNIPDSERLSRLKMVSILCRASPSAEMWLAATISRT